MNTMKEFVCSFVLLFLSKNGVFQPNSYEGILTHFQLGSFLDLCLQSPVL